MCNLFQNENPDLFSVLRAAIGNIFYGLMQIDHKLKTGTI